jgi:transcriptional regulator with XRE-family HTH domain
MTTFGERLKLLRSEKKLTLSKLSKILGTTNTTLCHYENDIRTPNCEFVKDCAIFFNVSADYLLGISSSRGIRDSSNYIRLSFKAEDLNQDSKNLINYLATYLSKYNKYLEGDDYGMLKVFTGNFFKFIISKNKEKAFFKTENQCDDSDEKSLA